MMLCVDWDPVSLSCHGFCHSLSYSPWPALAGCLSKCPHGLCVKNLLPFALFSGLTASNSFVCQQLQRSHALQLQAGLGAVGVRRPRAGSSVRAGSCHVSFGGWGFLTWCQSGCVPVCAKHVSLHHPRYPSAYFIFVSLRNQCVSWSQISYSRHSLAEGRCRAVVWGQKKNIFRLFWDSSYIILGNSALQKLIKTKIQALIKLSRTNTTVCFLVIISKPLWHFIECSHTGAVIQVWESQERLGGEEQQPHPCLRELHLPKKNYIVDSCDVTIQGSVSCQQPLFDISNQA